MDGVVNLTPIHQTDIRDELGRDRKSHPKMEIANLFLRSTMHNPPTAKSHSQDYLVTQAFTFAEVVYNFSLQENPQIAKNELERQIFEIIRKKKTSKRPSSQQTSYKDTPSINRCNQPRVGFQTC